MITNLPKHVTELDLEELDEGFGGRDEGSGGIVLTGSSSLRS
jgi:hypothetical protein